GCPRRPRRPGGRLRAAPSRRRPSWRLLPWPSFRRPLSGQLLPWLFSRQPLSPQRPSRRPFSRRRPSPRQLFPQRLSFLQRLFRQPPFPRQPSGRRLSPPLLSRRLLSRPPLFQPPCVPVRAFAFLSVRPAGVLLQGAPFPSRPRPRGGRVLLPRASCVLVPARFQDRAAAAAVFPRAAAPEEARAGAPAGA